MRPVVVLAFLAISLVFVTAQEGKACVDCFELERTCEWIGTNQCGDVGRYHCSDGCMQEYELVCGSSGAWWRLRFSNC
jgi:hypothetical protein